MQKQFHEIHLNCNIRTLYSEPMIMLYQKCRIQFLQILKQLLEKAVTRIGIFLLYAIFSALAIIYEMWPRHSGINMYVLKQ